MKKNHSRRQLLKQSTVGISGVALGTAAFSISEAQTAFAAGRRFERTTDFIGSYRGSYDGRNASVKISSLISFKLVLEIVFTDIDHKLTYKGIWAAPSEVSPPTHILANIKLNQVGGSDQIYWSKLYLHTWDISYMSGVSVRNNVEFGMSFTRT